MRRWRQQRLGWITCLALAVGLGAGVGCNVTRGYDGPSEPASQVADISCNNPGAVGGIIIKTVNGKAVTVQFNVLEVLEGQTTLGLTVSPVTQGDWTLADGDRAQSSRLAWLDATYKRPIAITFDAAGGGRYVVDGWMGYSAGALPSAWVTDQATGQVVATAGPGPFGPRAKGTPN